MNAELSNIVLIVIGILIAVKVMRRNQSAAVQETVVQGYTEKQVEQACREAATEGFWAGFEVMERIRKENLQVRKDKKTVYAGYVQNGRFLPVYSVTPKGGLKELFHFQEEKKPGNNQPRLTGSQEPDWDQMPPPPEYIN